MKISNLSSRMIANRDFLVVEDQLFPIDLIIGISLVEKMSATFLCIKYKTVGSYLSEFEMQIQPNCINRIRTFLGMKEV